MKIKSAVFMRGIKGEDEILENNIPQVAFIGRSNVGKSSLLNSLTGVKNLARTSNTPGRTQELNVFLINNTHYFIDLPGYGFAKTKIKILDKIGKLIFWYLFRSGNDQTVVLIIDAEIGPSADDLDMLDQLEKAGKKIIIVANKVDKIKKSHYKNQLDKLREQFTGHKFFPYSSKSKIGMGELSSAILIG